MSEEKRCSKCGEVKPLDMFSPHPECAMQRRGVCKACASLFASNWNKVRRQSVHGYLVQTINTLRQRSKALGIGFDLDLPFLIELWESQGGMCALSKLPMEHRATKHERGAGPYSASVDRINPRLGYTKGNVRFLLFAVNTALNEWGDDIVIPIMKAVVENHH